MGQKPSGHASHPSSRVNLSDRLEERIGKIPVTGRYHRSPRKISDDYDVLDDALGSGYNGVVKLATRKGKPKGDKFAVKAFKLLNVVGEKKSQLESEVEIFLSMDHPHITRLYDVYEGEDALHLVMECCEGGELFDRVKELKKFSELDAADSVWQMLLSLNYIHQHGIAHRDLKLENFLYDKKGSSHLKLIDFGFSKIWETNIKMHVSCGTLSYVAPEVLKKSYTSQCDVWSLGVITFILLSGYMPFSGPEAVQMKNIQAGAYVMKPAKWDAISENAREFVKALLEVNPDKRLTAQAALDHPWIARRTSRKGSVSVDLDIAVALRDFGHASKFRRCCMEMMAWSLSNEERAKVRDQFIAMDINQHGTITLQELKKVLNDNFVIDDAEINEIFNALDTNHDEEIHYSDFLAAMVSNRIAVHEDLMLETFKKFDVDSSGYITVDNLRDVIGNTFEGEEVEKLLAEGDLLHDGRISYSEFVAYLKGTPLESHTDAASKVLDAQIEAKGGSVSPFGMRRRSSRERVNTGSAKTKQCCVVA
eukprot:TRINITY_DN72111_c0_g1_i1.p1 TRINITY_DN72111_c0_g1~~TRINITY_DN72111_c0_g1_i1.p1  ORF type:complete len:536 (-),score=99.57 TRINITY_DN72111_c0_g1_i1:117-1724(-)